MFPSDHLLIFLTCIHSIKHIRVSIERFTMYYVVCDLRVNISNYDWTKRTYIPAFSSLGSDYLVCEFIYHIILRDSIEPCELIVIQEILTR